MKILALSYLFPNSLMPNHGIFVWNRLKALSKYVDVKVINPVPWSPVHALLKSYRHYRQVPARENIGGLDVHHPRFFSIPGAVKSLEATTYTRAVGTTMARDLAGESFDLIDMHWTYPDLPAGLALARRLGKPAMVTLRGREAFYLEDGGKRADIIRDGLAQVDRIVALSNELAEISTQLIGPNSKTHVIRNGVDTAGFDYMPQAEARAHLGIGPDEKIILMVGALIRRKGFDLVIEALQRQRDNPVLRQCKLYIVGAEGPEGDYRAALYRQVKEANLEERVVLAGAVPNAQLQRWYCAADVFCLASRGEGSPNVLTEALACGCPSVAADVGAVREIMASEPGLGECVPSEDVDAFAAALGSVLSQTHARETIASAMRKYDWDWCARQVMEVYRQVVEEHRRGGGQGA
jgi:glycosyltransferase involved in cell wall biosynthesis